MRCLTLLVLSLSLVLSLTACAALTSTSSQGDTAQAGALAKVKAGAAYLTASLAKVRQAVTEVRAQAPELAAAIEAKVGPALATLESEVAAYEAAGTAADVTGADSLWSTARAALSKVLGIAAQTLGPKLLSGLLGA